MNTSRISSLLTPLTSAPLICTRNSCGRFRIEIMARLSMLRVLRGNSSRPQIAPQQYSVTSSWNGLLKSSAVFRLRLAEAVQRAKFALAWERSWPHLARVLTVGGLFLVASWAGLWLALPSLARAIGLVLFAVLALSALFPLLKFRWPSREAALSRLDRGTGIRHR